MTANNNNSEEKLYPTEHGNSVLGVKFAPMQIPRERRLQTFAVAHWVFFLMIMPFLMFGLLVYTMFYTSYWWITFIYAIWLWYDWDSPSTGGYDWIPIQHWRIWRHYDNYFPLRLEKMVDLDPEKKYVFGCHPHGIISYGVFGNIALVPQRFRELFPGIKPKTLTLTSNFYWPIRREYFLLLGGCDVSKQSIESILSRGKGHAVAIVVGGAEEALDAHPGKYDLTLMKRKGFIKMAIKHGAYLVPVFSFGENELYHQIDNNRGSSLRTWQTKLKSKFGFSPPIFFGRGIFNYSFGLLPHRHTVTTVVGEPVPTVQCDHPTHEQLNQVHAEYIEALHRLFESNKSKYGIPAETHLNIV